MRRAIPLLATLVALSAAATAGAQPHVRRGTIRLLKPGAARVRVVVTLRAAPLALHEGRNLALATARRKLDVHSSSARAYVARLAQAQARAVAQLQAAVPEAQVGPRFQVVLDALTVSLPYAKLPALVRQGWVAHVYPSLHYTVRTNRSPGLIGADVLHASTGADGSGIKIAVVDDGIDQTNPFFDPGGYSYPAGFPKGIASSTTAKVIVARVFPGPNAGKAGRLPVDPESSFHGTHVAGIAAGDANTTAPAGGDHPRTTGLSGVAPRAWLGNYRVFTVPTPEGHVANTPEIVEAFEAAVKDGMDVINFSGGGPEVEPQNDALVAATHAVAAAGVVPVFAAGNDRDDYGNGTVGSPGTAPDAISVAATSNAHVFAPALDVPGLLTGIPFRGANGQQAPPTWETNDQTLVDVGTIAPSAGDRLLCGPPGALDRPSTTLPPASLQGDIALVERGTCPFVTKAQAAQRAGAIGIVFIDNRPGEANVAPASLPIPGGTIAEQDGRRLVALLDARGGKAAARVGREPLELDETQRANIVTSFSSAGPTDFGHFLKPDVSAPGGQILSSTLANTDDSRFAVFDGTSMATPHVSGSAALLLQLHRSWTPAQIKSALVDTATAAYADSDRTQEAPVTFEGGGLASLPNANDPQLFAAPATLSFGDLAPGGTRTLLIHLADAGDGAGTWTVRVAAQSSPGVTIETGGLAVVPPGGSTDLAVTASATTVNGDDYGFVVLQHGSTTRRIPFLAFDDAPALAAAPTVPLHVTQSGTTAKGENRVTEYRYPDAPLGYQPGLGERQVGAETVYESTLPAKLVNAGVSVLDASDGAQIDPWYLGRKDENTVQGYAGTPVDMNDLTYDFNEAVGAAGVSFPAAGTYDVAVDSGQDQFTGRTLGGRYVLHSWVNDVTPPTLQLLTTHVTAGRPTIVFRTTDAKSGVDPASLTIGYRGELISVGRYERRTGLAVFPLPRSVTTLRPGTTALRMLTSDFQETKNIDTSGSKLMPNTRTASTQLHVVAGASVDWLLPEANACAARTTHVEVVAGSPAGVARVVYSVDGRRRTTSRHGSQGIWSAVVRLARGTHVLVATTVDKKNRTASVRRIVRTCSG